MAVIVDELGPNSVRDLLGEERTVVIRRGKAWEPEELVEFYKDLGNVVAQNDKVTGTIGTGELVKVRQNGLFAGKKDGELEWHSAGMNRTGHDDIVASICIRQQSGRRYYFTDLRELGKTG